MTLGAPRNSTRRSNRGDASDTQNQDSLRARARRRLIGAVALVLLGVIVFPLVFDAKPKPVPSTIALDIPSQSKAPSLSVPASAPMLDAASAVAVPSGERNAVAQPASAPVSAPKPRPSAAAEVVTPPTVIPQPALPKPETVAPPAAPVAPKPTVTAETHQPVAKPAPAQKPLAAPHQTKELASARQALAALEGKSPDQISVAQAEAALAHKKQSAQQDAAPSNARFVVQAGAFADAHTAQAVRNKIEKAGFKTYTQVVDTPQGKRVRVRVGPFDSRDEAARALHKLQALGLSGAVLTL